MNPASDWAWLKEMVRELTPPPPDPAQDLGKIRSPAELLDLAGRLMEEGEAMAAAPQADTGRMGAVRFRDGLMLAVLVYAIIRRRSLLSLDVNDAIIKTDDGYTLTLQRKDTKARRPELIPLPSCLSPAIERYCEKHRLSLLAGHDFDALWISVRGTPLGGKAIVGSNSRNTRRRNSGYASRRISFGPASLRGIQWNILNASSTCRRCFSTRTCVPVHIMHSRTICGPDVNGMTPYKPSGRS